MNLDAKKRSESELLSTKPALPTQEALEVEDVRGVKFVVIISSDSRLWDFEAHESHVGHLLEVFCSRGQYNYTP